MVAEVVFQDRGELVDVNGGIWSLKSWVKYQSNTWAFIIPVSGTFFSTASSKSLGTYKCRCHIHQSAASPIEIILITENASAIYQFYSLYIHVAKNVT